MDRANMQARAIAAEAIGTMFLLMVVIGSGIMGDTLSGGNTAIALLANSIATGAALAALILTFGPISGGHFNPVVTLADAWQGGLAWKSVPGYILAQLAGALAGTVVANLMFGLAPTTLSTTVRSGNGLLLGEFIATFGLMAVIWGVVRKRGSAVPYAVGAYILSAYWFTSSTSFANPAVTIARVFTDTFTGIRPNDITGFILMQLAGAAAATLLFRWLVPTLQEKAADVVIPHK